MLASIDQFHKIYVEYERFDSFLIISILQHLSKLTKPSKHETFSE